MFKLNTQKNRHKWKPCKALQGQDSKKSSIQPWIEDFQKTFFDPALHWRLKIFQKLSSIQPWIEDWRLKIFKKLSSIQPWIEDWRLKIFKKLSSIQPWIEDWRFSKNFLRSWINLQSSIQGSKKVFWTFSIFNLQSRDLRKFSQNLQSSIFNPGSKKVFWKSSIFNPGSKKVFWKSSIFNPGLDWRKFFENLQSSIQDRRKFSENLQSGIFDPGI